MQRLSNGEDRALLRVLGISFGLAITVGETVGIGILRTPGVVAGHLDRFWPVVSVWIVGGIFALLGANALAELGTMMPRSGGQYVFARTALGEYPAFVVGWSDWLSLCGSTAAVAILIGEYVGLLFHKLAGDGPLVATIAVVGFTILQWRGIQSGSRAQMATTTLKIGALLVLVGICFFAGNRNVSTSSIELEAGAPLMSGFVLALAAVIVTYNGWSSPIYFAGEMKDPGRDLPRAMLGGVAIVMVLYLLINLAFLRVLPLATMAGEKLPAGVVAEQIFGPSGHTALRWISVVSLLSAISANLLLAPRVLYAMSRDGLFSRHASDVNGGGTPTVALFLSSGLSVLLVVSETFEHVVALLAFFFVTNYAISFVSLFVLRRKAPEAERPWRAWGHPYTTAVVLGAAVVYLIFTLRHDVAGALGAVFFVALSIPAYFLSRRRTPAGEIA